MFGFILGVVLGLGFGMFLCRDYKAQIDMLVSGVIRRVNKFRSK
jgi:C4-dicarboxylate transporter